MNHLFLRALLRHCCRKLQRPPSFVDLAVQPEFAFQKSRTIVRPQFGYGFFGFAGSQKNFVAGRSRQHFSISVAQQGDPLSEGQFGNCVIGGFIEGDMQDGVHRAVARLQVGRYKSGTPVSSFKMPPSSLTSGATVSVSDDPIGDASRCLQAMEA